VKKTKWLTARASASRRPQSCGKVSTTVQIIPEMGHGFQGEGPLAIPRNNPPGQKTRLRSPVKSDWIWESSSSYTQPIPQVESPPVLVLYDADDQPIRFRRKIGFR
jgi:hypothetical protein